MIITEIWRYPVKSMGGHRVPTAEIDERGLHADRLWAVRDLELDAVTTARRLPKLMLCSARFAAPPPREAGPGHAPPVVITFPDGQEIPSGDLAVHERLSDLVGRDVELQALPPVTDKQSYRGPMLTQRDLRRQFEIPDDEPLPDISMFPLAKVAELARYATPIGMFADAYPLHLLTTGSLHTMRARAPQADFDVRRFRPNLVIDANGEFDWCGGTLTTDHVQMRAVVPTLRCSMPVRQQPALAAQPDVMRTIKEHSDRCLGIYANVERGGRISEGDDIAFHAAPPPTLARRLTSTFTRRALQIGARFVPHGRSY